MTTAGNATWIYEIYLLDFSFRKVACAYFITMATNAEETTTFAFGCLFPRIAKS